jgi:hypothetical protein
MPVAVPRPRPEIRASQLKADLVQLLVLGEREPLVRARMSAAALAAIEHASRLEWLPFEIDIQLVEAIETVAGERALREWSRSALLRTVDGPLLRPLVTAVTHVFGLTPSGLLTRAPLAWTLLFRNVGELRVTNSRPGGAVVLLLDLPPIATTGPFLRSIAGALEGLFALTRAEGEVELEDFGAGRARFALRWSDEPDG